MLEVTGSLVEMLSYAWLSMSACKHRRKAFLSCLNWYFLKKIFWCWGWTSPCELPTCVASALLLSHTQLLLLLFHLLLFTAKLIHINIGLFIDFIWLYILKTLIWIVYMSSVFPQASIYLPTSMPPFLPPFFPPTHLSIIYLPGSAGDETQSLCMLGKC